MSAPIPRYRVELDVKGQEAVLDVPSLIGPEAAGRRAKWTAIAAHWADVDEVRVVSVQPLLEASA